MGILPLPEGGKRSSELAGGRGEVLSLLPPTRGGKEEGMSLFISERRKSFSLSFFLRKEVKGCCSFGTFACVRVPFPEGEELLGVLR